MKRGDISINRKHNDDLINRHCVLNDGNGNGYILTSKEYPAENVNTFEIEQNDVLDFAISGKSYITDTKVESKEGKVIGAVKKDTTNRFFNWLHKL